MKTYIVILFVIVLMVGVFLGAATRFFNNFGSNIARNHMNEIGVDLPEYPEDEEDERLR